MGLTGEKGFLQIAGCRLVFYCRGSRGISKAQGWGRQKLSKIKKSLGDAWWLSLQSGRPDFHVTLFTRSLALPCFMQ
jgi:hypothetical protein